MAADFEILYDHKGKAIRLTVERLSHILGHPEMISQRARLVESLAEPDQGIATMKDETVHAYHRFFDQTPVTRKYLIVVVKMSGEGAFVLTAFFSNRVKRGNVLWQK
jgi:hypothetical protein